MDPSQTLSRLKALGGALTTAQRVSLAGAFAVVVLVMAASTYWLQRTDYALLFADMDPEAAGDVVTRLKAAKVDYRVEQGGRSIRVAAARVDELRLEFASTGLPSSGRIGFEIFDRTAFGATEFLEQVNYRRALEGEIARTIGTLAEVSSARVHIAMSHSSLFASKEQPAKASVVLKLRGNRPPANGTVQGIANLVASSVEGLRPEAVVILDSFGRPLARPAGSDDEPTGGAQMERQQRIERDLTTRVASLLEPVVGAEGVRVNVSVRLDPQSEEATEEKWDPTTAAIRSRQVTGDAGGPVVARLPRAWPARAQTCRRPCLPRRTPLRRQTPRPPRRSGRIVDTPTAPAPAVATATSTTPIAGARLRDRELRDQQGDSPYRAAARRSRPVVGRRHPRQRVGGREEPGRHDVAHDSRAQAGRDPEDQFLVAAAVGLDATRGDLLTIENVPFEEIAVEEAPKAGPGSASRRRPTRAAASWASSCSGRSRSSCSSSRSSAAPPWMPWRSSRPRCPSTCRATSRISRAKIEAQLDAGAGKSADRLRLPVLTRRLGTLAAKEPEHAARLLRMWMSQENR